jgi:hypothetical protein
VVVEVCVRDSNPVSTVRDVKQTIQIILSSAQIARKIAVVDPNICRLVNTNSITVGSINLGDLKVTKNHILLATNVETHTSKSYSR